ncbi:macrolide family glycosyltransferase [Nonomuraea dietziae]
MLTMSHIAMVSIPAPGHVNPSLEVIAELVRRGHRVTYANDPSYHDVITSVGAEPKPYTSTLPTHDDPDGWPDDTIAQLDIFLRDNQAMTPQLRQAYDADRPDLFLYDIGAAPARVLATQWNIPIIQLSPTYVARDGYESDMAPLIEHLRSTPEGADHYRRAQQWLDDEGIDATHENFVGRPDTCLVLIPRALQPNADRVDAAHYTFIGPCTGPRTQQGTWQRPHDADHVILVSLGSAFTNQPAFYRECLKAFGDLPGWHLVLQIGKHVDPADLGPIPATTEIHTWAPQLDILRQADAFVTHAGMGGAAEGLTCAVPMIAVPQAVDQFSNADRLTELGVAHRLDTDQATATALRQTLLDLTGDPHVTARLAAIQHQLQAEGGTKRAADLIEAALH